MTDKEHNTISYTAPTNDEAAKNLEAAVNPAEGDNKTPETPITPETPVVDAPVVDDNAGDNGGETDDNPEPDPEKRSAWWMKELKKLRAKNQEVSQEKEALAAKLEEALKAASEGKEVKATDIADIDKMVNQRAEALTAMQAHNKRADEIYQAGKKDIPDFQDVVDTLGHMGAFYDAANRPTSLLETVAEMPDAHKILAELAKDPEHTTRLLEMPVVKQVLEISKIQQKIAAPKKTPVSSAPDPISPLSAKGKSELAIDDPKLPREEYARRRAEQRAARRR